MSFPPGLEMFCLKSKLNADYQPMIGKTQEDTQKSNLVLVLKRLTILEESNKILRKQLEEKDKIIKQQQDEIDEYIDALFVCDMKINKEFNVNNYSRILFRN